MNVCERGLTVTSSPPLGKLSLLCKAALFCVHLVQIVVGPQTS